LRKLASEHAQLHTNGLPPNYIWPLDDAINDGSDLSQLTVLLAGPESTPFSAGIFTLQLSIPNNYPSAPPSAAFKTKIFHPNVDPKSGAVCVDTLKRDWKPELKLWDILVVISCLLISPNPASALNAEAGRLCEGDFAGFERRVRTWVNVHARSPPNLAEAVTASRRRGEKEDEQESVAPRDVGAPPAPKRPKGKKKEVTGVSEPLADSTNNVLGISGVEVHASKSSTVEPTVDFQSRPPATPRVDSGFAAMSPPALIPRPQNEQAPSISQFEGVLSTSSELQSTFEFKANTKRSQPHAAETPSWLLWQRNTETKPDHEGRKRQKLENRRLKAAGGSLARYNSGAFGVRKGLKRL
jgi:ubiquitin-conjugating enzyme E2 S